MTKTGVKSHFDPAFAGLSATNHEFIFNFSEVSFNCVIKIILPRKECIRTMSEMILVLIALAFFSLAHKFYFSFFAAKVAVVGDTVVTHTNHYLKQQFLKLFKI